MGFFHFVFFPVRVTMRMSGLFVSGWVFTSWGEVRFAMSQLLFLSMSLC